MIRSGFSEIQQRRKDNKRRSQTNNRAKPLSISVTAHAKMEPTTTAGFLEKLGAVGIKSWRLRWFVLDHTRCLAFYYDSPKKAPQDFKGFIDLTQASFEFDLTDIDPEQGTFKITTFAREYLLRASCRQQMLEWIDAMQTARRTFLQRSAAAVIAARMCPRTGHEGADPPIIEQARVSLTVPRPRVNNIVVFVTATAITITSTATPGTCTHHQHSVASTSNAANHNAAGRQCIECPQQRQRRQ
ncbi:hypothetical protein PTSG_09212, partial [Salpingoeca rosetta]